MIAFYLVAALAALVAAGFAVLPLISGPAETRRLRARLKALDMLREEMPEAEWNDRRTGLARKLEEDQARRSRPLLLVLAIALAIPPATFLLYRAVGEPASLDRAETQSDHIRDELRKLAGRVNHDPDDAEAWLYLGLAYRDLQMYPAAEGALRRLMMLEPDNAFVKTELAEVLLFASDRPRLPAESRRLLEQAVRIDPYHQKALWLLGIGAYQDGEFEYAANLWRQLDGLLEDGGVRSQVREQIARAEAALGTGSTEPGPAFSPGAPPAADGRTAGADRAPAPTTEAAPAGLIVVEVSIEPAKLAGLGGDETVFLFARATSGPPMPLAVRRLRARDLPARVELRDGDAMVENIRLSDFAQVDLIARVSHAGTAEARPGDLEGRAGPVRPGNAGAVALVIDRIVE